MNILYEAHWFIPWAILVVGMVAIIKFARGYMNEAAFTRLDRGLMTGFRGLLDLQAAIGFIYFLRIGFLGLGFPTYRILHGIIMLAALAVAHLSVLWKNADDRTRFINNFYVLLVSFLLMLLGISLIPN